MCRSIMFLSKMTHQMWRNDSLNQRNKATKRAGIIGVYLRVGVCVGERAVGQKKIEEGGGLGILCQLWCFEKIVNG